jgi:hypothetical protein
VSSERAPHRKAHEWAAFHISETEFNTRNVCMTTKARFLPPGIMRSKSARRITSHFLVHPQTGNTENFIDTREDPRTVEYLRETFKPTNGGELHVY